MTENKQSAIEVPVWEYAYGGPASQGKIKTLPDDFIVEEQLSFEPEGSGEHVFLQIEKCGENTDFVARLLARFAGVRQRDVSYAGIKDRHARTTQWFSIWLPGKQDPEWKLLETETIKVLQALRHARKLKRGVLSGNQFKIRIRDWQGDKTQLQQQLQLIKESGFPNYFGVQRFGNQGQNVNKALGLFLGEKVKREQRSLYLSAARSYLFNQLLSSRVLAGNWNQVIEGDVCIFDQSNSYFKVNKLDDSIVDRVHAAAIHPTGMMYGKGESEVSGQAQLIEQRIINNVPELAEGLVKLGLTADRRALRVMVKDLYWEFLNESELELSFSLSSGSYATSLLRELVVTG